MTPEFFPKQWVMIAGTLVIGFFLLFITTFVQQWIKSRFWMNGKNDRRNGELKNGTQQWINQLTSSHDRFTESLNEFTTIQQKNLDKLDRLIQVSRCKIENGLEQDVKDIKRLVIKIGGNV